MLVHSKVAVAAMLMCCNIPYADLSLLFSASNSPPWSIPPVQSFNDETQGRTAEQESDEGSEVFLTPKPAKKEETFQERDELESPEPPEAPDTGRDDSQLIYSTVPKEHIQKKR